MVSVEQPRQEHSDLPPFSAEVVQLADTHGSNP
jgi:hypothetical protein